MGSEDKAIFVFTPNTLIKSSEVNANNAELDARLDLLETPIYAGGYVGSNTGVGYKTLYQAINSGITFDNLNKYTITTAGIYYINFQQLINTSASPTYLMIYKSGVAQRYAYMPGGLQADMTVTDICALAVGNYIQLYQSVAVTNAWEAQHSSYQIICIKRT